MKDLSTLTKYIDKISKEAEEKVIKAQRETAEVIWSDVINKAPYKTGDYVSSIQISDTKKEGNTISTRIFTDKVVETKEGNKYNLGFLLETGTDPHAIPNAFGWGDIYGYESEQYKRTLSPDWHPGTIAQPHFLPALQSNEQLYIENIRKALKGGK